MVLLSPEISVEKLTGITSDLHKAYPKAQVTVLDTSDLPQV